MVDDTAAAALASQPTEEQIIARLKRQQNFGLAIPAGLAAAIVGAALWAGVVFATQMNIGLIAVAVGALVGYAIRKTGNGLEPKSAFSARSAARWAGAWALC